MTQPHPPDPSRKVGVTYRLLSGLIVAAGAAGALAGAWAVWQGADAKPAASLMIALPGIAWLLNLATCVAFHGRAPAQPMWPFATERVLSCYLVLVIVYEWL